MADTATAQAQFQKPSLSELLHAALEPRLILGEVLAELKDAGALTDAPAGWKPGEVGATLIISELNARGYDLVRCALFTLMKETVREALPILEYHALIVAGGSTPQLEQARMVLRWIDQGIVPSVALPNDNVAPIAG